MNTKPCPNILLIRAIWVAAAMMIVAGSLTLAQSIGLLESQLFFRIIGVAFGLILMITANYFPKQLFPYSAPKTQRRIAWLFVIAGLLYNIVWITGDTQRTQPMFALLFAPACILSMLLYRYAKLHTYHRSTPETQS